ncbi:MAG: hypothetical protein IKX36_00700 [Prevotella sp.]|nr:hypothetical protein [Prevotella sp.]
MRKDKRNWMMGILTGMMGMLGFSSCCSHKNVIDVPLTKYGPPVTFDLPVELIEVEIDGKTVQMTRDQYQEWRKKQQQQQMIVKYGAPTTNFN